LLVNRPAKVAPWLDPRHVHEHRTVAKIRYEIMEQAASLTFGVFPPITNEDCAHGILPIEVACHLLDGLPELNAVRGQIQDKHGEANILACFHSGSP
jgi:hypothetical protein